MINPPNAGSFLTSEGWTVFVVSLVVIGIDVFGIIWALAFELELWKYGIAVLSGGHMICVIVMIGFMLRDKIQWMLLTVKISWLWFSMLWIFSVCLLAYTYYAYMLISGSIILPMLINHCLFIGPIARGEIPLIIIQPATSSSHSTTQPPNVGGPEAVLIHRPSSSKTTKSQEPQSPHLLSPASARKSRSSTRRSRSSTSRSPSPTELVPLASPKASTKPSVGSIYEHRSYHATGSQSPSVKGQSVFQSKETRASTTAASLEALPMRKLSPSRTSRSWGPQSSHLLAASSARKSPSLTRRSPSPTKVVPLASPEASPEPSIASEDEYTSSYVAGSQSPSIEGQSVFQSEEARASTTAASLEALPLRRLSPSRTARSQEP